ncbi:pilus assembly FimT family protein [Halomonas nitroreducens]|nr:GspH/FimT family pseudopilin [Halomonas nitroreducens]
MTAGKCFSRGQGFTLIELLVTIAVIAIMATVAVPNFQGFVERNRQAAEFNKVLSGFHYARSEAVKTRDDVTVSIDSSSGSWVISVIASGSPIRVIESKDGRLSVDDIEVDFNALGRLKRCEDGEGAAVSPCVVSVGDSGIEVNAAGNIDKAG